MLPHLLASALFALVLPVSVVAQEPPPVDSVDWQIYDGEGNKMDYRIEVTYLFTDIFGLKWYHNDIKSTITGQTVAEGLLVEPPAGPTTLRAYSNDSGLSYNWVWNAMNNEYEKQGGSPAVRTYKPIQ